MVNLLVKDVLSWSPWVFTVLLERQSQPRVTSARMGQQGEVQGDRAEASKPNWGVQGKLLTGVSVQAETYRVRRSWPCEDG